MACLPKNLQPKRHHLYLGLPYISDMKFKGTSEPLMNVECIYVGTSWQAPQLTTIYIEGLHGPGLLTSIRETSGSRWTTMYRGPQGPW